MSESFVTVATFATLVEAELARNRLDEAGVNAFLADAETVGMLWHDDPLSARGKRSIYAAVMIDALVFGAGAVLIIAVIWGVFHPRLPAPPF